MQSNTISLVRACLFAGWILTCVCAANCLAEGDCGCGRGEDEYAESAPRAQKYHHDGADQKVAYGPEQRAAMPMRAPVEEPEAPVGAFVAPPQTGAVQGSSGTFGMRGMELEFPALRLRMPSLTLPSFFRQRGNARMLLEGGAAPYTLGAAHAYGVPPTGMAVQHGVSSDHIKQLRAALQQAEDRAQQRTNEAAAARAAEASAKQLLEDLEEREKQLNDKMKRLQECLDALISRHERLNDEETAVRLLPKPVEQTNQWRAPVREATVVRLRAPEDRTYTAPALVEIPEDHMRRLPPAGGQR